MAIPTPRTFLFHERSHFDSPKKIQHFELRLLNEKRQRHAINQSSSSSFCSDFLDCEEDEEANERTMTRLEGKVLTLEEAVSAPRKHRSLELAAQPMPNFKATEGTPFGLPLAFRAAWDLADRPRRIALLMDDCQEEYRPYAENANIVDNLVALTTAFREKKAEHKEGGVACVWSSWSRMFDDGISNAMDRWYGPRGLRPEEPENAVYVFTGEPGMKVLREIEPTPEEMADGWFYHGRHLDMFWNFTEDGKSYLDEKLKAQHIDTGT